MTRVLVVEDEPAIREAEVAYLQSAGYEVSEAADGATALEQFGLVAPHAIVLDLSLPQVDGLQVCRILRQHSSVPIIMVTARTSEIDELLGLEIGADDYLKKPFHPRILVARVQALLRRIIGQSVVRGPFVADPDKLLLLKHGQLVELTTMQFNILYRLLVHPGIVLSREQLIDAARDHEPSRRDVYDRTIDAHIKAIRKRIEDEPARPRYIQTVIGRGYRFVEVPDA